MGKKKKEEINLGEAAKAFIEAKRSADLAVRAKKQAEEVLMRAFNSAGVEQASVGDTKIFVRKSIRKSYDLAKFKKLLSPFQLRRVTKQIIDTEMVEAAVKLGHLEQSIVDRATSVKVVSSVMVMTSKQQEIEV